MLNFSYFVFEKNYILKKKNLNKEEKVSGLLFKEYKITIFPFAFLLSIILLF